MSPRGLGPCPSNSVHTFHRDSSGAILVIGLFFAIFLIACLWFLMGIASATIYRMHNQEASDAIALSAAIVHARGMNFIAASNLSMVGLVGYWRVMAMLFAFLGRVMTVTGPSPLFTCQERDFITEPYGVDDCEAAAEASSTHDQVGQILAAYTPMMEATLIALSEQQDATVAVTPTAAQEAARYVAKRYSVKGETFSAAMVPTWVLSGAPPPPPGQPRPWLGLPARAVPFTKLCKETLGLSFPVVLVKVEEYTPSVAKLFLEGEPDVAGFGQFFGTLGPDEDLAIFCSSPFWSTSGPKFVPSPAGNGHDWMQVWGLVPETYKDELGRGVELPEHKGAPHATPTPTIEATYFAEAEFFFDCSTSWSDGACNGGTDDAFSLYSMRWRARLRRTQMTAFGHDIAEFVSSVVPIAGKGWPFAPDGTTSPESILH